MAIDVSATKSIGILRESQQLQIRGRLTAVQIMLIIATLSLFTAAFLPTVLSDFTPQDQWRAFRYSVQDEGRFARWKSCSDSVAHFYIATGRPLVWLGECTEHWYVSRIADFRVLRVFSLLLALATLLILARVLSGLFPDPSLSVITAALVLYSPGYCFMYYQGLTGAPVMLAAALGMVSFLFFRRATKNIGQMKSALAYILSSGAIFILACFIYPAFAFTSLALALLYAMFENEDLATRLRRFAIALAVYGGGSSVYLLASELLIKYYFDFTKKPFPSLGPYQFEINLTLGTLLVKMKPFLAYFWNRLPIANLRKQLIPLKTFFLVGIIIFGVGRFALGWQATAKRVAWVLVTFVIGMVLAIAPLLVSGFNGIGARQTFTWQVIIVVSIVFLMADLLGRTKICRKSIPIAFLAFSCLLVPATFLQIKNVMAEILQSDVEIRYFRTSMKKLIESGDFYKLRHLHVIRPASTFSYNGNPIGDGETNTPASISNPEHIYQMFTAVLRDLLPNEELKQFSVFDCKFDAKCVSKALEFADIVLTQSKPEDSFPITDGATIIDFTLAQPSVLPLHSKVENFTIGHHYPLAGRWFFKGRPCIIKSTFGRLIAINESGSRARLIYLDSKISVPQWSITGAISQDGSKIVWSNGSTWTRK